MSQSSSLTETTIGKTSLFLFFDSSKLLWLIVCLFLVVIGVEVESPRGQILLSCSGTSSVNIIDKWDAPMQQESSALHVMPFFHTGHVYECDSQRLPSGKMLVSWDGVIAVTLDGAVLAL